jgi:hypothetical protein
MKPIIGLICGLMCLWPALPAHAQDEKTTPLFREDTTLEISIVGPIGKIAREADTSTKAYPATIYVGDETLGLELSARGKSRRKKENCRFPPLRISFTDKPGEHSPFYKQKQLKLVTHCNRSERADQILLREYAAYRLFNLVTPKSLKVRLANVTYLDGDRLVDTRPGFLIEDADDAARRLGMKEVDIGDIPVNALNQADAARFALFQYLIGNTDWAMIMGPDPQNCCHNSKLLGMESSSTTSLTPVPYDFDNAGIVDAPYAYPNAELRSRSVKDRIYRGFCRFNELIPNEAEYLRGLRAKMEAEIGAVPGLTSKTREKMIDYLASGIEDIEDEDSINRKLLRRCR